MNASHQLHSSDENPHLSVSEKLLRILSRSLREKQNVTESRVLRTRAPTHMLVHFPCCAIWQFCARSTLKKNDIVVLRESGLVAVYIFTLLLVSCARKCFRFHTASLWWVETVAGGYADDSIHMYLYAMCVNAMQLMLCTRARIIRPTSLSAAASRVLRPIHFSHPLFQFVSIRCA